MIRTDFPSITRRYHAFERLWRRCVMLRRVFYRSFANVPRRLRFGMPKSALFSIAYYTSTLFGIAALIESSFSIAHANAVNLNEEPVMACVVPRATTLDNPLRAKIAACLGWQSTASNMCYGEYEPFAVSSLPPGEIEINADQVSLYNTGRSQLTGHVEVHQNQQMVNAETAYIYRDAKTNKVQKVELLGDVHYAEPGRLMIAKKAVIYPENKSGYVEDVLYRFQVNRSHAVLPAWGRASVIQRFPNKDYDLKKATYSTCAPQDKSWQIEAKEIHIDDAASRGVAKHATIKIHDVPLFYTPYLSFPTSKERKSGFLMPIYGYSNVGGFDLGLPFYWNIAPNYDATITPHLYSNRGVMMGGDFRYLTAQSAGIMSANFLPGDRAFGQYIKDNQKKFPILQGISNNRWAVMLRNGTNLAPNLNLHVNYQQVSDDYYLQDFTTNLAALTQNQLLQQADITYAIPHWQFGGMLQSYQTLTPINQSVIANVYRRLPQLHALGAYQNLPLNGNLNLLGQFDYFQWPVSQEVQPQGARYHFSPLLTLPQIKPWGFFTPALQLVENYYDVNYGTGHSNNSFNRTIPRYSVDSGLYFDRDLRWGDSHYTQTLEPRLFYLNVPYHGQMAIPVYDSAYMIFNQDQLFRNNRFSGYDRIGDANQLSYALTTRWLSGTNGQERASLSVGQIHYFANRRVQLCYNLSGNCQDNPLTLGVLSPTAEYSPLTSRAVYRFNRAWMATGNYIWDVYAHTTNNGNLNLHYQPAKNEIFSFGYSYLANGDLTIMANKNQKTLVQNNALNQGTVAFAWPLTERISSLGVYSYNISKQYGMMSFFGMQYDTCCWALRLVGGRTFKSINPVTFAPQYNNNVFLQVLLKGLGSAANGDPTSVINTYLPGYQDQFQH